jgi:hypothetical protein
MEKGSATFSRKMNLGGIGKLEEEGLMLKAKWLALPKAAPQQACY